jgi:hypothetical protein
MRVLNGCALITSHVCRWCCSGQSKWLLPSGKLRLCNLRDRPHWGSLVTDLQGPPSERTPEEKLWDFKTRAQQYARDRRSCDDTRISYMEFLETEAEDDLALAQMIAG